MKVTDILPICPVTGHRIENTKRSPSSEYEGKRYSFQCPSCKAEFDRDHAKYVVSYQEKLAVSEKKEKAHSAGEGTSPEVP